MDLTKILAISGKPGLYKMITQTKNGFIVESLLDEKRFPVFAHERVSTLEEISIFSSGEEDIPLKDVFKTMFEKLEGKAAIDPKSDGAKLQEFFTEMVPEHDSERVYTSDIKKVLSWYNLLLEKELLNFDEEEESKEENETEEAAPDKPEETDKQDDNKAE
jgi:hypothetical protein